MLATVRSFATLVLRPRFLRDFLRHVGLGFVWRWSISHRLYSRTSRPSGSSLCFKFAHESSGTSCGTYSGESVGWSVGSGSIIAI